jgi:DNA polymerase-3 subunit delta
VKVIDFVKRFPLSGDYNLLIVKDAKNLSNDFKNIISYLDNVNPKTILVLAFNTNIDKRKKIYKSAQKYGVVFESKKIYDNQVYKWIENQCANKSLNLHPNSIKIISDFTGNDLSQIDNELEKLKLNSKKGTNYKSK